MRDTPLLKKSIQGHNWSFSERLLAHTTTFARPEFTALIIRGKYYTFRSEMRVALVKGQVSSTELVSFIELDLSYGGRCFKFTQHMRGFRRKIYV